MKIREKDDWEKIPSSLLHHAVASMGLLVHLFLQRRRPQLS